MCVALASGQMTKLHYKKLHSAARNGETALRAALRHWSEGGAWPQDDVQERTQQTQHAVKIIHTSGLSKTFREGRTCRAPMAVAVKNGKKIRLHRRYGLENGASYSETAAFARNRSLCVRQRFWGKPLHCFFDSLPYIHNRETSGKYEN